MPDFAYCNAGWKRRNVYGFSVYSYFISMRDRTDCGGHSNILVDIWPVSDSVSDSDRRYGSCHDLSYDCDYFWKKDQSDAEKYDA